MNGHIQLISVRDMKKDILKQAAPKSCLTVLNIVEKKKRKRARLLN